MAAKLIFEPHGGLANRMRVLASGLWLAGRLNKRIQLIWNLNSDLNCPFDSLFEPISGIEVIEKKCKFFLFRSTYQKPWLKRLIIEFINILISRKFIILEDAMVKKIQSGEKDLLAMSRTHKTLFFRTGEEFGDNGNQFDQFVPKPEIKERIGNICSRFNEKTIGVHIRRTDHEIATALSPTWIFIERLRRDLERDPGINFFLATDDPATEATLTSLFGQRIITVNKEYTRNNPKGIKDALVEFYCLANTTMIYGSFWSSFSYIAARVGKIKCETLKISHDA